MFSAVLKSKQFHFETTAGLFSKNKVDEGSRLLINSMEIAPEDNVLDLGCGYGPIGLTAATLASKGIVWMVDTDIRAVKYSKLNAELNHINNVKILASDGFEEIPDGVFFDVIVSHPPTHAPKETIIEFIENSRQRLKKKGGQLYFVTESRVRPMIKREFERVFDNCKLLVSDKRHAISFAEKK